MANLNQKFSAPSIAEYVSAPAHPSQVRIDNRKSSQAAAATSADKPLVSIITIVRNCESTIERTIQSIQAQDYRPIEYIVVDGASTDKTLDIVKKYPNVVTLAVSEPDKGIFDAYNKGIALCSGELIGMLNADDWYNPDTVSLAVKAHREQPGAIVHGKLKYWDNGKPAFIMGADDTRAHIAPTVFHPTTFIPKKVLETIGGFRTEFKIAGDFELFARAKHLGVPYAYIEEVLTNMSLMGISDRRWVAAYKETYKARKLHGMSGLRNSLVFGKMFLLTLARRSLEGAGLSGVVKFYRKNVSSMEKTYLERSN